MKQWTSRLALLAVIGSVLSSALVMGCGGGGGDDTTVTNTTTDAAGNTTTTESKTETD
jgi:hypothetical protein